MSAQSSHRASFADEERYYRPSSSHTSHSLKSSPRDAHSRPSTHTQSHSAKDNTSSHHSSARSPSPPHSRLRTFSSSTSAPPLRTSSHPSSSAATPSQFHPPSSASVSSSAHMPLLSDTELHELQAAFQVFDRAGTGRVPTNLLLATLRSLPPHPSHSLLSSLLSSPNDRGSGGVVTFGEFVGLLTAGVGAGGSGDGAGRAEWERVFALMDEGGKGWLDESDMERVRRMVGGGKGGSGGGGKSEVRAMLARADLNGDGVVSKDEFVALMMEDKLV